MIDVVIRLSRKTIEELLQSGAALNDGSSAHRLQTAKSILAGRRRRAACFRSIRFHDPSWDMILELYVANGENRALAVSQLCGLSGGSTTTALRHIEHLEALGYFSRGADPDDRRRVIVTIRPALEAAFEQWIDFQIAASRLSL